MLYVHACHESRITLLTILELYWRTGTRLRGREWHKRSIDNNAPHIAYEIRQMYFFFLLMQTFLVFNWRSQFDLWGSHSGHDSLSPLSKQLCNFDKLTTLPLMYIEISDCLFSFEDFFNRGINKKNWTELMNRFGWYSNLHLYCRAG